jgi:iron complex transport system permease protein
MTEAVDTAASPDVPAPRVGKTAFAIACAAALTVAVTLAALAIGPVAISPLRVAEILLHLGDERTRDSIVVLDVRLPRVLLGLIVGATTAVSGAVMQGLFRNPIADPGIIGVSSGAALAAAIWFVLGAAIAASLPGPFPLFGLPISAFLGGLAVTAILYQLSRHDGRTSVVTLILAGIAISAGAGAGIGILVFIASDQQLREFTFWTLGSLGGATFVRVVTVLPLAGGFVLLAPWLARGLDALALGEAEAFHMGINVERMKRIALAGVAAAIGSAVAVSGIIAFVGLAVPHIVRLSIGPAHRGLLIVSAFAGAALLVGTDLIARTIAAPAEVPLGVITTAFGAPFMLWLLMRRRDIVG